MNFHLGCAVWSYKGWIGDFYPPKSPSHEFLSLYSQRFTAVEGNTTFYAVPDEATLTRWVKQTPSGFEFCPKFPKTVTHTGSLADSISDALSFLERIQTLEKRLGTVFAQLPPTYSPQYLDDLSQFLQALPYRNIRLAVEVRHQDWFKKPYENQLNKLLEQLGIARVILDTRPIYNCPDDPQAKSSRRKPNVLVHPCVTANFSLIRFISHPQQQYNQDYLEEWVKQVNHWLRQGTEIYFFVHCPQEERSPHTARYFQHRLESEGINIPALPWNTLTFDIAPQQLRLF